MERILVVLVLEDFLSYHFIRKQHLPPPYISSFLFAALLTGGMALFTQAEYRLSFGRSKPFDLHLQVNQNIPFDYRRLQFKRLTLKAFQTEN